MDLQEVEKLANQYEDEGLIYVIPWDEDYPIDRLWFSRIEDGEVIAVDGGTKDHAFDPDEIKEILVEIPDAVIYRDPEALPF